MRIMCIHPKSDYNIGDLMTFSGMKYLATCAFGQDVEFMQFDMRRAMTEFDTYISEYNWGSDADVIMIGGTPCVSDDSNANILRLIKQARKRWPDAKLIALGIGSFFRYKKFKIGNYTEGSINTSNDVQGAVEAFRDFDLVIVRDIIAHQVLLNYGIMNTLYYDMSAFSCFSLSKIGAVSNAKSVLVYCDPQKADVWAHLPPCVWERYRQFQIDWAEEHNAQVVCISSADQSSATEHGIQCIHVADLDWMAYLMSNATSVLTPRVHQAILASIMGCQDVSIMPIDSRYTTALNAGVQVVQPTLRQLRGHPEWDDHAVVISDTFNAQDEYLFPYSYRKLPFSLNELRSNLYTLPIVEWLKGAV